MLDTILNIIYGKSLIPGCLTVNYFSFDKLIVKNWPEKVVHKIYIFA